MPHAPSAIVAPYSTRAKRHEERSAGASSSHFGWTIALQEAGLHCRRARKQQSSGGSRSPCGNRSFVEVVMAGPHHGAAALAIRWERKPDRRRYEHDVTGRSVQRVRRKAPSSACARFWCWRLRDQPGGRRLPAHAWRHARRKWCSRGEQPEPTAGPDGSSSSSPAARSRPPRSRAGRTASDRATTRRPTRVV